MKVDGIELLRMIQNGEITEENTIKSFSNNNELGQMYLDDVKNLRYKNGGKTCVPTYTLLERKFEIIKKIKPIEKIRTYYSCEKTFKESKKYIDQNTENFYKKINELIDYLKYKEEESKK